MTIATNDVEFAARDGLALRGTLFEPASPQSALIVGSATAVPRGFYRAFATYAAQCGAAVLTYDYRGSGEPPAILLESKARMRDWGDLDFPGAIEWMSRKYAGLPLRVVGHSHGGHALLMAPNNGTIERAVTIATQLGYWRLCAPGERYRVWALLNLFAPLMMGVSGYVPGSRLGLGEDLAAGVMREWRQWCNMRNYFFDDPTMSSILARASTYRAPTLVIGMRDDTWGTPAAIDGFAAHFTGPERLTIDPREHGLGAVGHFGFFRARNGPALWPIAAAYLGLLEVAA